MARRPARRGPALNLECQAVASQEIDISAEAPASPDVVFALLGDSTTWPDWTPIDRAEIIEPNSPDGTGEIRVFKTGRITVREQIVERVPDQCLSYVLLAGLPLKNYRAEIDLEPTAAGTRIRWHTTFDAKVPGTGWIYRTALEKATRQFVDGLARATVGKGPDQGPGETATSGSRA